MVTQPLDSHAASGDFGHSPLTLYHPGRIREAAGPSEGTIITSC
jgi:hypothetical protein